MGKGQAIQQFGNLLDLIQNDPPNFSGSNIQLFNQLSWIPAVAVLLFRIKQINPQDWVVVGKILVEEHRLACPSGTE